MQGTCSANVKYTECVRTTSLKLQSEDKTLWKSRSKSRTHVALVTAEKGSYSTFILISCTLRGSNPGGGKIFRNCPDRLWDTPSLLYSGYRLSFAWLKRPGRGVNQQPSSSAEVKERVEL